VKKVDDIYRPEELQSIKKNAVEGHIEIKLSFVTNKD
jgi:hypothetical protein